MMWGWLICFLGCDDGGPRIRPPKSVVIVDDPPKPYTPPPPRKNQEGHPEETPIGGLFKDFATTCIPEPDVQAWLKSLYIVQDEKLVAAANAPEGWGEYISVPKALYFPTYTLFSVEVTQMSFLGYSLRSILYLVDAQGEDEVQFVLATSSEEFDAQKVSSLMKIQPKDHSVIVSCVLQKP